MRETETERQRGRESGGREHSIIHASDTSVIVYRLYNVLSCVCACVFSEYGGPIGRRAREKVREQAARQVREQLLITHLRALLSQNEKQHKYAHSHTHHASDRHLVYLCTHEQTQVQFHPRELPHHLVWSVCSISTTKYRLTTTRTSFGF